MKKHVHFLLSLLLLLVVSCQSTIEPVQPIIGSWRWVQTQGGWNSQELTTPGADEVIVTFLETGRYVERTNGVLSQKGDFSIETNTYTDKRGQPQTSKSFYLRNRVFFDKDGKTVRLTVAESAFVPIEMTDNKLIYADLHTEGNTYTYQRQ